MAFRKSFFTTRRGYNNGRGGVSLVYRVLYNIMAFWIRPEENPHARTYTHGITEQCAPNIICYDFRTVSGEGVGRRRGREYVVMHSIPANKNNGRQTADKNGEKIRRDVCVNLRRVNCSCEHHFESNKYYLFR